MILLIKGTYTSQIHGGRKDGSCQWLWAGENRELLNRFQFYNMKRIEMVVQECTFQ